MPRVGLGEPMRLPYYSTMLTNILTPGQADLIGGTYGPQFANLNSVSLGVKSHQRLSTRRILDAMRCMEQSHPPLRASLTNLDSVHECLQLIAGSEVSAKKYLLHEVDADEADLQRCMDESVSGIAQEFDIVGGKTWGIVHLRTATTDYLVFVFNHAFCDFVSAVQYIQTFIRSHTRGQRSSSMRDSYEEYLKELEHASTRPQSADVLWWQSRPWAETGRVPGLHDTPPQHSAPLNHSESVPAGELDHLNLSDTLIIKTLGQSLRPLTPTGALRVDVAAHGRDSKSTRAAGGWIAHALPYFLTGNTSAQDILETRKRSEAWPVAFSHIRARKDISLPNQISGNAFVNFLGSFDPKRWHLEGFTAAEIQPAYQAPGRVPLTPIQLKIRKGPDGWLFDWTFSPSFADKSVPAAIRRNFHELLRNPAGAAST